MEAGPMLVAIIGTMHPRTFAPRISSKVIFLWQAGRARDFRYRFFRYRFQLSA